MWVPAGQWTSPHMRSPLSTYMTWGEWWPWRWTIMPGSQRAHIDRYCSPWLPKVNHFSHTDFCPSGCIWVRTCCTFRSSSSRWRKIGSRPGTSWGEAIAQLTPAGTLRGQATTYPTSASDLGTYVEGSYSYVVASMNSSGR